MIWVRAIFRVLARYFLSAIILGALLGGPLLILLIR
ncbi:hypothetical protein PMI07_004917 [Rhizobium sp. CF080]|nr:hypothetical protein PMI07_004917 [Rhizobium sp. CF080]